MGGSGRVRARLRDRTSQDGPRANGDRGGRNGRFAKRLAAGCVAALLMPATASAGHEPLADVDKRSPGVAPTAAQRAAAEDLGATARWNDFGTPRSLFRYDGDLATGVQGDDAETAARAWLTDNQELFGLGSTDALEKRAASRLGDSPGWVVTLAQRFGDLRTSEDGLVTVGLTRADGGWNVTYASSTLSRDGALAAQPSVSAVDAWLTAARDVNRAVPAADVLATKRDGDWHVLAVKGLSDPQRARLVALPTPRDGVRPAWETLVVDNQGGHATGFAHYVDAATGEVVVRRDIAHQSHDAVETFAGAMPTGNGACADDIGPFTVADDEDRVGSVAVSVEAALTTNDSVIELLRDGEVVANQDTVFSPEALAYDPPDEGRGEYKVRVCDYTGGGGWSDPKEFSGQIAFSPADAHAGFPYPPKWKVFPAYPPLDGSQDIRELWCWQSQVGGEALEECQREVMNPASRAPWDWSVRTNAPTFTTSGNNAHSAEAWTSPFTPGATGFRPVGPGRDYTFAFGDAWRTSKCSTPFVPGESHDVAAATANLFAMHNRMHDWAYTLGFTEEHWNAQDSNFGSGGTADEDALLGDVQAGALSGGFPSYLGRDNANMITLPDGVHPITNMYLWQPIAGAFYAPCVDGDFDMAVIGHEYGHLIENRMIGKGNRRSGHHAGAMGESSGDLLGVEYLNEDGLVPVSGENRFALGAYVTGNGQRGIRNYGMNFPQAGGFPEPGKAPQVDPLNFSNIGYDLTGAQVHADGEIWSATNHAIRQALVEKYDGSFPEGNKALQRACAAGERPPDQCPGNRRWIQMMFDAYLLMPTAPSMLDARDAYLAADRLRFGGANQAELWNAFAGRGFGEGAWSTNGATESKTDPRPDFSSPHAEEAAVTFEVVSAGKKKDRQPVEAEVYVGHFEGRVSPVADTDPGTAAPAEEDAADNLDATAAFVPGTYEFVVRADGYGHVRVRETLDAGNRTVTVQMPRNHASKENGAAASGDGAQHAALIDDTEATNWDRTGAPVEGSQVTVDLAGDQPVTVGRVQVSAMLLSQNRFTALRQFAIETSTDGASFQRIYTSAADAFPGAKPRPVSPELILRSFDVPDTQATHVRIVALSNQCTGSPAFQGSQDADPLNGTDCREGSPGNEPVAIFGDLPQVVGPRDTEVHIAELQVFSS